jgi:hypothetical protein
MYKAVLIGLLAAVPTSTNFTLQTYDFGNGSDSSSSSNYGLQSSTGSPSGSLSSSNYKLPAGIRYSASVATPPAPTVVNPDNGYDRLKITLGVSGMPIDTKYIIAISDDDFVTTQYIQSDQTVGPTADSNDYQAYAAWGGASGFWVLGLDHNVTYKVKVAALQGAATGSAYGPTASASTVAPSVTFAVSTSLTASPPFAVGFGSLTPGSVLSGNATVLVDVTTNALNGGAILIKSQNAGLSSTIGSTSISSTTADLTSANSGYGAQVTSASQSSGGPITASSPFTGSAGNVGGLLTTWQQLANFPAAIGSANVATTLKAKAHASTTSATDYADTLGIAISLSF